MFGQDVTLWGPTHLVMINGAILSVPVLAVLALESRRARRADKEAAAVTAPELAARTLSLAEQIIRTLLPAALLFAIAFWATEFDWGVPQYRVVWHPLLLALAGGLALTTGRVVLGRGGALRVMLVYLLLRGAVEVGVWVLGRSVPAMPLFAVEALGIELLALALLGRADRGMAVLRFGAAAGLLCGTVGFAAQYAWTQLWAPVPWTPSLLAEGLPTAVLAGVAGGLLGALLGSGLRRELPARAVRRRVGLAAAATLVVVGANALWTSNPTNLTATVTLAPVAGRDDAHREAVATVRFSDAALAKHAQLRQVLAWQGGNRVSRRLEEIAPGVYRTDGPVPLYGDYKTNVRVQSGRASSRCRCISRASRASRRPASSGPSTSAPRSSATSTAMQTERRDYVPGWLWTPSALLMLLFCGLFVLGISTGLARVAESVRPPRGRTRAHRASHEVDDRPRKQGRVVPHRRMANARRDAELDVADLLAQARGVRLHRQDPVLVTPGDEDRDVDLVELAHRRLAVAQDRVDVLDDVAADRGARERDGLGGRHLMAARHHVAKCEPPQAGPRHHLRQQAQGLARGRLHPREDLDDLLGGGLVAGAQAAGGGDADDAAGAAALGELERERAAHRVADQVRGADAELVEVLLEVVGRHGRCRTAGRCAARACRRRGRAASARSPRSAGPAQRGAAASSATSR